MCPNTVLVQFDQDGVRFYVVSDGDGELIIKEFKGYSTVTLSTKRQRADN